MWMLSFCCIQSTDVFLLKLDLSPKRRPWVCRWLKMDIWMWKLDDQDVKPHGSRSGQKDSKVMDLIIHDILRWCSGKFGLKWGCLQLFLVSEGYPRVLSCKWFWRESMVQINDTLVHFTSCRSQWADWKDRITSMQLQWELIELSCQISCQWLPGLKFVCVWHSAWQVPSVWSEVQECPWHMILNLCVYDSRLIDSMCALVVLYMAQMCFTKIFAAKVTFPDHGTLLTSVFLISTYMRP
jgi:hypothetical protein